VNRLSAAKAPAAGGPPAGDQADPVMQQGYGMHMGRGLVYVLMAPRVNSGSPA